MTGGQAKLAVAGVFVAGIVTGMAATRLVLLGAERTLLRSPDPVAQVIVWKLGRELRLSAKQRGEIRTVIREARKEAFVASRDVLPKILAIYDASTARIAQTLDERQRRRFAELAAARRMALQAIVEKAAREAPVPKPAQ